jgi:hypothetical protein
MYALSEREIGVHYEPALMREAPWQLPAIHARENFYD